ncbi:MAG: glycosyltransferase family 9 protein [Chloroflexota bacterium]
MRRIVIFRALYLGDMILASPAFRAIRAGYPDAEITLIGLPWAAEFARRFRCEIDRFLEFPGYPGLKEIEVDHERMTLFLQEQRRYDYDLALQMHGSGRISNRFIAELGARFTVGYFEGEGPSYLTIASPYPDGESEIDRNLGLARLLGCPEAGKKLAFPLFAEDREEADRHLSRLEDGRPEGLSYAGREDGRPEGLRHGGWREGPRNRLRIGIHPGSRASSRRWPPERFAAVADHFARRHRAIIVLTGGRDDQETCRAVETNMWSVAVNLAGKTSLGGLAAVVERLDLFVSNDTGPAHIAGAVDTPSVRIFGPADPERWAPLNQDWHRVVRRPVACSPCSHVECPIDHRCMLWISTDTVVRASEELLFEGAAACNA